MKNAFIAIFFCCSFYSVGQVHYTSIQQEQLEYYNSLGKDGVYYEENHIPRATPLYDRATCNTNKVVFGWHPYWSNGKENNYQWDLLTDLSYFSYELNPSTGNANSTHSFSTANVVTEALNHGVRVNLCVTLFSDHTTFFNSPTAQQTFITNVITLLQNRGATGVNLDFEGMTASHKTPFKNFVANLSTQLKTAIPNAQLSVALYAVEWSSIFDVPSLNQYIDLYCIMGYDYYYSGSSTTGPSDPLFHFGSTYNYSHSKSVTYYLNLGVPKEKLVLALPYYGRSWQVTGFPLPASTVSGTAVSVVYSTVKDNANGYYSTANRNFAADTRSTYYNYYSGGNPRQCFITEENDMRERLDFIRKRDIGGMGMWALGFDDGYPDFWNAISDYMTDCYQVPCSGTLYDIGGGPNKPYYDKENYSYTIAPPGASNITVDIQSMNIEQGYDYLYIYDGTSTGAPQVPGSPFTGTNAPAAFTTTGGAFTLKFTSDGATTAQGFKLNYTCNVVLDDPISLVNANPGWKTEDFEQTFDDSAPNSSLKKNFYNVADFDGTEWRSNATRGFFTEDFNDGSIHSDWTIENGTWSEGTNLKQSNESEGNSNIYASLTQSLSNTHIYAWKGKISGSGTNRRAGIHIFSDDPTAENRGNSYLVYFRPDAASNPGNEEIQIYKVENDVLSLKVNLSYTVLANTWYNYKVIFDRITGELLVYVNDELAASWTDPTPIATGDYISFRSGNCTYEIDNLRVYRSRFPQVDVLVGPAATNDMRYQNPSPTQAAGVVRTLSTNTANRISEVDSLLFNVDWTAPVFDFVNDGDLNTDLDTIYVGLLSASSFWNADDPNSGISNFEYAIGTTPGSDDIINWSPVLGGQSTIINSGNFILDELYYFTIRAINGANLIEESSSDGFRFISATSNITLEDNQAILIYPNPTKDYLNISIQNEIITGVEIYSADGKLVKKYEEGDLTKLNVQHLTAGNYIISIKMNEKVLKFQWIKM
ncbi:MAG: T9SS type A sorting domain-containing protein [Brumimicrobium sp.]|nr:T9SS type A sorting domain-containing protein [Brumimicrobium sp.]